MATRIVRAKSIIDALSDPTPVTNAMAVRIAEAFAFTYRRGVTLTNEQKSGVFIKALRDYVKQVVRDSEVSRAMETERVRVAAGAEIIIGTDGDE